jgi:hypothetical protein
MRHVPYFGSIQSIIAHSRPIAMGRFGKFYPFVILCAALALFVYPLPLGRTLTQFSDIYALWPGYGHRPPGWFHSVGIDATPIFLLYPSDLLNRALLRAGELFSWNPFVGFGTPWLGAMQGAPYFPAKLISMLWPDYWRGQDLMLIALLMTAGVGNYLLLRAMGVGRVGATFSGLAYMLCQRLFLIINMPAFTIECLLPVMLYAVHQMVRHRSVGFSLLAGFIGGGQFLAGFPETSFILGLVTGAFFLWLMVADYRRGGNWKHGIFLASLAVAVTLALSAFQLAEFATFLLHSTTAHHTGYGTVVKEPFWLLPLLLPNFFGTPFYGPTWPSEVTAFDHFPASLFCGVSTLILAIAALLWRNSPMRGTIWFFTAVLLVFVGYDFGFPILRSIGHLPLFNLMTIVWNAFVIPFAISVLAGFGVHSLRAPGAKDRVVVALALYAAMLVALLLLLPAFGVPWRPVRSLLYVVPVLVAAVVLLQWWRWSQIGVALLLGLITLESYLCVKELKYLHYFGPRMVELPSLKWLADNLGHDRMFGIDQTSPANTLSASRIRDIRHFDAMFPVLYLDYAEAIWRGARNTVYQTGSPEWKVVRDPLLDLAAVKFIITRDPLASVPAGLTQVYSDRDGTIYRSTEALARARFVPEAVVAPKSLSPTALKGMTGQLKSAVVLQDYPGTAPRPACSAAQTASVEFLEDRVSQIRLKVAAPCRGFVVLADLFYPGWQATIDGKDTRIYKANYAFRAVEVDAGTHEVVFAYRPVSLRVGVPVAILTALGLIVYFVCIGVQKLRARRPRPAAIA